MASIEASARGANSSLRNLLLDEFLCKKGQFWSKPYRYKIRKNATEFRRLGLIHPTNQWLWTKFYQEYDDRILHLCSLSSMSVRAPKRVAATFYTPSDLNINNVIKGMTATTEEEESHLEYSTSYFSYRGYIRLYQFYSSAEFLNLEKRFPHLTTLDVARCFDSIYTHTMAWAVTSKTFSKQNLRSKSFSDDFDTHMQFCNEGETNGIIIGPEVSRVFAEIILQRVDKVAEATLQAEKKTEGVDYVLRRYVDDVLIFATDEETADLVYERYSDALRTVNLSVNASKKKHDMRPFVTAKSKSIVEVTRETILFLGELFDLDSPTFVPRQTWRQEKIALGFIRRIKLLCLDIGSSYDDVASYVIATITRQLIDVVQASRDPFDVDTGARAYKSFSALLEVLFFLYSVAPSVTASYTLGRALVVLIRFVRARLPDWDTALSERVIASIREFLGSACRSIHKIVGSHVPLEAINILLIAAELGEQYPVGAHLLEDIFVPPGQTVQTHKWTYFEYISCMYAMGSSALYADLRQQVITELDKTLANLDDLRQNSELAHLVLDMSVCPHVDLPRRGMWLRRIAKVLGVTVSATQIAEYDANNSYWFVNWSSLDILNVLQKKELSPAY